MSAHTIDERRAALYQIAQAIAPTWERRRAEVESFSAPVREWMLRELDPRAGDTVLELAAGVGDTGYEAATAVGDHGGLITTDFSPAMVEAARRRGAELGLSNVEYRVMDAERIELADDSVDGVLCRFGYMLMPDPAAALAETRRVLRPSGRLALAVWGDPERNPFFAMVVASLIARGHIEPPDDGPAPGPFSLASPDRIVALLEDAGFGEVATEEVPVAFTLPSVNEYVNLIADTSGPIGLAVQGLTLDDRAVLVADVAGPISSFATADGYEIPGVAVCAVAG